MKLKPVVRKNIERLNFLLPDNLEEAVLMAEAIRRTCVLLKKEFSYTGKSFDENKTLFNRIAGHEVRTSNQLPIELNVSDETSKLMGKLEQERKKRQLESQGEDSSDVEPPVYNYFQTCLFSALKTISSLYGFETGLPDELLMEITRKSLRVEDTKGSFINLKQDESNLKKVVQRLADTENTDLIITDYVFVTKDMFSDNSGYINFINNINNYHVFLYDNSRLSFGNKWVNVSREEVASLVSVENCVAFVGDGWAKYVAKSKDKIIIDTSKDPAWKGDRGKNVEYFGPITENPREIANIIELRINDYYGKTR